MSDQPGNLPDSKIPANEEGASEEPKKGKDSFDVPLEKSPWTMYALFQIPILIIMVLILYFMYQNRPGN